MAKIFDLDMAAWQEWVDSRPPVVKALCERLPPDRLYRLKGGNRVTLLSYAEDGTLRVLVSGQYSFVTFEREVFGIKPEDLTECDLPTEGELTGALLTEEADVKSFIDEIRPAVLAARDNVPT
jgi:hypothetical protein